MIKLIDIQNAEKRLKGVIKETKLIYSKFFSDEYENEVYIKPENLQETGAFKIRGAYNKISKLSEEEKKKGIIASSAGNHAQGVAFAAAKLGAKATIVMPKTTPLIKVESTKAYGSEIVLHGEYYDQAYEKAMEISKEKGYNFVHPFNDYDVMAGQGTIALEILEELSDVDIILVPIGGGGLISGIAVAIKEINPKIKVIGVEPEGAQTFKNSLEKGEITDLEEVNTIAEGVAVKTPGDKAFDIIKKYVDDIIVVPDTDLMGAFLMLLERHKLVAENAGVLSLSALKYLNVKGKKVVSLVSGGNIDVVTISAMINRGLVMRERIFAFSVELPDEPGELLKITKILTEENANIVKLDHDQFKTLDRFRQVHLEVTLETNGKKHVDKIVQALEKGGYKIDKVYQN